MKTDVLFAMFNLQNHHEIDQSFVTMKIFPGYLTYRTFLLLWIIRECETLN